MSTQDNPFEEAVAQKEDEPATREDCHFGPDEEDAIYDAYLILRDAGYDFEEVEPLAELIGRTTIYDKADPEKLYQTHVAER